MTRTILIDAAIGILAGAALALIVIVLR